MRRESREDILLRIYAEMADEEGKAYYSECRPRWLMKKESEKDMLLRI